MSGKGPRVERLRLRPADWFNECITILFSVPAKYIFVVQMSNHISDLYSLERKRADLLQNMLEMTPIIPGAYKEVYRKCGKTNCWCHAEGGGHPLKRITWTEKGFAHSKAVTDKDVEWVLLATENYRLFRLAHAELREIQDRIEETLEKIEWEKIKETRKGKNWI